jgi:hypothetical protein
MWHEVRRIMAKEPRATSVDMMKAQLQVAWQSIPLSFVNKLVWRQEKVRKAVLEAQGMQTQY